ncbi:MAG: hypothetical protein QOJ43_74 [Gaiellaceae bacterium]|nr:hypothetical protein [Gaiellaceae bacterium]
MFRLLFSGKAAGMQIRKLIERRIRQRGGGVDLDADVNATVAANVGERGAVTKVSSTQTASAGEKPQPRQKDGPAERA